MTRRESLRTVPVEDRAWLLAALDDALRGGAPVLPVADAPGTGSASVAARAVAGSGVSSGATDARPGDEALPAGTAVLIRTSGSSGISKTVALSAAALEASAAATHEALGGPGQWLVTLPAQLISGLQMLVRSRLAGIDPVFFDQAFDPEALLTASERMDHTRRYVSLVPVQLARLLDFAEADRGAAETLRGFAGVLVGGQATPLRLRQRAHDLGVSLRRSYGMSETAGGCVYDGSEIGDTRVRIRDGEVQISGSCLALGYVGNPELTAAQFIVEDGTRWYRTGDAGQLLGGMLTVTGRLDRVIISGGVNVSLDEVERVVQALPGWHSAVALGVPHPEWGERVTLVREILPSIPTSPASNPRSSTQVGSSRPVEASERASTAHLGDGQGVPAIEDTEFDALCAVVKAELGAAAVPLWANELTELPRLPGGKPDVQAITRWVRELRETFKQSGSPTR